MNDGQYGNSNSWLAKASSDSDPRAGVIFTETVLIDAIAFGRANNSTGEIFEDRYDGTYTLQYSTSLEANADNRDWTDFGQITLAAQADVADAEKDKVAGGEYTGWLRHQFDVKNNGAPLQATGIRLRVPTRCRESSNQARM